MDSRMKAFTQTLSASAVFGIAASALILTNTATAQVTTATSVCIDSDGDGWGWDGTASCLIENFTPTRGDCIDTDGDGWGWDGIESCLIEEVDVGSNSDDTQPPTDENGINLAQLVAGAPNFTVLATALQLTGLDTVLSDDNAEFTVLAPNDQAFELLGEDTISALIADPDTLRDILLTHVLPGRADSTTALSLAGTTVASVGGQDLAFSVNDDSLYVNTSKVIATDFGASNGIAHVIDRVILPRPATDVSGTIVDVALANGSFNTLVTALQATGLDALLADADATFTVFAPTDDAFAALGDDTIAALLSDTQTLSNILLTHVISGVAVNSTTALSLTGGTVETASGTTVSLSIWGHELFVNNSQVIITDIVTDNGIIHVIDSVIQ